MSLTVTVKEHVPVLLDISVAEQFTVVTPFGNVDPDAGVQVTPGDPPQLSVEVGCMYLTTASQVLVPVVVVTLVHPEITGASVSLIVTVNEHIALGGVPLLAVQDTVVTPLGKAEPDAGEHVTVGVGVPVAVGVNVTTAVH